MVELCSVCGSEWLYKAPKDIDNLCEVCYTKLHQATTEYHALQDDAYEDLLNGDIKSAIASLRLVQVKRNETSKYFRNYLNDGHYRFANEFIPALINQLVGCQYNQANPVDVWELAFVSYHL